MARAASAVAVYAVLLTVAALFGPWWAFDVRGQATVSEVTVTVQETLGLNALEVGVAIQGSVPNGPSVSTSMGVPYDFLPGVGPLIQRAGILALVAMVAGVVSAVLAYPRRATRLWNLLAGILCVVAFVLLVLAPLTVLWDLPAAMGTHVNTAYPNLPALSGWSGQWSGDLRLPELGSNVTMHIQLLWGGGWSWFLSLIAGAFFLLASVVAFAAVVRPARPLPAESVSAPSDERSAPSAVPSAAEPKGPPP